LKKKQQKKLKGIWEVWCHHQYP